MNHFQLVFLKNDERLKTPECNCCNFALLFLLKISGPVVQRIVCKFPKLNILVRFQAGPQMRAGKRKESRERV